MSYSKSELFSENKKLRHGFIILEDKQNLGRIAEDEGLNMIKTINQVHSDEFVVLSEPAQFDREYSADAVISVFAGHGVGVYSADCVPILFFDEDKGIFGAIHAGWKGTLSGITTIVFDYILNVLKCSGDSINVAIGPCIEGECYEIGEEVAAKYRYRYTDCDLYLKKKENNKFLLDLRIANTELLKNAGIYNIDNIEECTKCNEKYPSYRREGKSTGRMLSFIGFV